MNLLMDMFHAVAAIGLSLVGYWFGLVLGAPVNMDGDLGLLFAVLIMGAYNIVLMEKRKQKD